MGTLTLLILYSLDKGQGHKGLFGTKWCPVFILGISSISYRAFVFHMLIGLGKDNTLLVLCKLGQRSMSHVSLLLNEKGKSDFHLIS